MIRDLKNFPKIYLGPGEFRLSAKPDVIITILGSCLAIVMHNDAKKISAVAHCILPAQPPSADNYEELFHYKYVDSAIRRMLYIFRKNKIYKKDIKVKLFGGAEHTNHKLRTASVGQQNINAAINILQKEGLRIVSADVGGNEGRKIYLFSQTGDVYLSRLGKLTNGKTK